MILILLTQGSQRRTAQAVTRVALTSALEGWGISELRRAIDEELSTAMDPLRGGGALIGMGTPARRFRFRSLTPVPGWNQNADDKH